MKALLSHRPGGPETLVVEDIPEPTPGKGELLIRVAAVGLNYPDALVIEDRYQFKPPRPFAPGSELSGTVEALGEGVEGFAPGDRILALAPMGALQELVTLTPENVFKIPDSMSFPEAAAVIFTYGTTIHALIDRGNLQPGETMLVLGAAGGIGISAVQVGKAMGARVVAAVSSEEKAQAAREAGADETIIYERGPFDKAGSKALADKFKAACPDGYDVVYDPVGGDYAEPALRSMGWEGRFLIIGFTGGIPKVPFNLPLLKACSAIGVFWGTWAARNPGPFASQMQQLFDWYEEGKIRPLVNETYPLERAGEGITKMSKRGAIGKLVVELHS